VTASSTPQTADTTVSANGDVLSIRVGAVEVLRARFSDDATPPHECRTPYIHPLRTLSGGVVTGHRPHDHRWHKGLTMAVPNLAGTNFWGGPTYVADRGYVDLDDVGDITTARFEAGADGAIRADHVWLGADGRPVLAERRAFAVRDVDPDAGSWTLEYRSELRVLAGESVEFKSPTVLGRELAGYCGLFWRGPRDFTGGRVLAPGGVEGAGALIGRRARWLAFIGEFDERDGFATLVFVPDGEAPEWFVRDDDYPGVNPSLAFRDALRLPPGASLSLGYRVVIADGAWSRERIEDLVGSG
jgi:hypothetical protein